MVDDTMDQGLHTFRRGMMGRAGCGQSSLVDDVQHCPDRELAVCLIFKLGDHLPCNETLDKTRMTQRAAQQTFERITRRANEDRSCARRIISYRPDDSLGVQALVR